MSRRITFLKIITIIPNNASEKTRPYSLKRYNDLKSLASNVLLKKYASILYKNDEICVYAKETGQGSSSKSKSKNLGTKIHSGKRNTQSLITSAASQGITERVKITTK